MDWIFVNPQAPKFIYWSPNTQCNSIRRWGLWKAIRFRWGHEGSPHDGISVLRKRGRKTRASSPCHVIHGHRKKVVICKPRKLPSRRGKSADSKILNFLPSRTMKIKCLLFKPSSLQYFVYQPELTKTVLIKVSSTIPLNFNFKTLSG